MKPDIASIVDFWDRAVVGATDRLLEAFVREMGAAAIIALTAWCLVTGWRFLVGDNEQELKYLIRRGVAMALLVSLALSTPLLNQYVRDFFGVSLPGWLTRTLTSAGFAGENTASPADFGLTMPGNFGTDLDALWAHGWKRVAALWSKVSYYDLFGHASFIMVVAATGIQIMGCLVGYLVTSVLRGMLIGFAPVFLMLALFDRTRPFFDRWLGKIVSLILAGVMLVAVTQMSLQSELVMLDALVDPPMTSADTPGPLQSYRVLHFIAIVCCVGLLLMGYASLLAYQIGGSGMAPTIVPDLAGPTGRAAGTAARGAYALVAGTTNTIRNMMQHIHGGGRGGPSGRGPGSGPGPQGRPPRGSGGPGGAIARQATSVASPARPRPYGS
ncbi:type IV secretion system protein [Paracraurococcus lichenis]|uniref:Type IV secretion system protein n=1 Tax=Paracraurococcus lichenis TaxID=3064888 RepID=A0ABT9E8T7_9PROT|nr:type IV secretion system protein [Paracraurococcus sp. LOR1-02]MDO9712350.1 type IV secretion system protein [Paracraurococcus sp. LOR1-02]